jgi:hypothetical protein
MLSDKIWIALKKITTKSDTLLKLKKQLTEI